MTKEDLDKMALDFNESRRLPGKRILNDVYQSEESHSLSDEEKKVGKKKIRQSGVSDSLLENMLKPKKSKTKFELKSKVVEHFQEVKLTAFKVENAMFDGMEFYVVNSDDKETRATKRYLEEQIVKHGGTRV